MSQAETLSADTLTPLAAEPWALHPSAAPRAERRGDGLWLGANGTRTLAGGWQVRYAVEPRRSYTLATEATFSGIEHPTDRLEVTATWAALAADQPIRLRRTDYLFAEPADGSLRFERTLTAPDEASALTVRVALRWTAAGEVTYTLPTVRSAATPAPRGVDVAVVTGSHRARGSRAWSIAENVAWYAERAEAALAEGAKLVVLPEVCVQWQVEGSSLDRAVPAPGPETDPFAALAERYRARLAVGLLERDGDAVHNSVVLLGPDGAIDGRYRKVHLAAASENMSGILPGESFPVFDTEVGRIGCNICMDSSAPESARMVGLQGADWLLLPIMGDHRADRWSMGNPIFSEDRWRCIQRVRAIDNQLCLVAARNEAVGSCIIDRHGEILAWNEGDQEHISARVALDRDFRTWAGVCFRDVNRGQYRAHVYGL